MTWVEAGTTGAGLGLAFFGGLRLTVRAVVRRPQRRILLPLSGLARLLLTGLVFYGLSREGARESLAALGGFWLARWYLVSEGETNRNEG
jgi:F1F0 ATPase subunit 2